MSLEVQMNKVLIISVAIISVFTWLACVSNPNTPLFWISIILVVIFGIPLAIILKIKLDE